MRKIESLKINYVGYNEPSTAEEVELEVLGLETVIHTAMQRIAVLKQSLQLQKMVAASSGDTKETSNEETVTEAADTEKAE